MCRLDTPIKMVKSENFTGVKREGMEMAEDRNLPQKVEQKEIEKKEEGPKRFVAKGPLVVYDTKTGLSWLKKDSWQEKGKFMNWHEAKEFAQLKNVRKIGGFDDWRLPVPDEIRELYSEESESKSKGGEIIHIDSIFPEGAFKTCWVTADTSTRRPRFDFSSGQMVTVDEYAFGSVRVCRRDIMSKKNALRNKG